MIKYIVLLPLTLSMICDASVSIADGYKYKSKEYTKQQLNYFKNNTRNNDINNMMSVSEKINQEDIENITEYLGEISK